MLYLPAAYVIVDDAHLHPTLCLVYQRICYQATKGIVLDDIHIDMDMMARSGDIFQ